MSSAKKPPAKDGTVSTADLPTRRDAQFRSIYVNYASFSVSLHDISMVASEIIPTSAGHEIVEHVRLAMTPSFAHVLAETLMNNLQTWERTFKLPTKEQAAEKK